MNLKDTKMSEGGHYRCCLHAHSELAEAEPNRPYQIGETLECPHCHGLSVLSQNGVFEYQPEK